MKSNNNFLTLILHFALPLFTLGVQKNILPACLGVRTSSFWLWHFAPSLGGW